MLPESQQHVLEFVASQVVGTTRGNHVGGKLIRFKLKGLAAPDVLAGDLAVLQPKYLTGWGTAPQNDAYALTFDGLLESSHADRAKAAAFAVLRTWIAKRLEDPEFRTFSWPEVKANISGSKRDADAGEDEAEHRFFDFVITLAKLAPNGTIDRGVWHWTTPENEEALMIP